MQTSESERERIIKVWIDAEKINLKDIKEKIKSLIN